MPNKSRAVGMPSLASEIATKPVKQRFPGPILGEVQLEEKFGCTDCSLVNGRSSMELLGRGIGKVEAAHDKRHAVSSSAHQAARSEWSRHTRWLGQP